LLKSSNEEQTCETDASGDWSASQANWESNLPPGSGVVSSGHFCGNGIRANYLDFFTIDLFSTTVVSSFGRTLYSDLKLTRKGW
jgi:hypothetical protein